MNWQLAVTIVFVAIAGLYLVRRSWRTWFGRKAGCGGGCGCASKPSETVSALISTDQMLARIKQQK